MAQVFSENFSEGVLGNTVLAGETDFSTSDGAAPTYVASPIDSDFAAQFDGANGFGRFRLSTVRSTTRTTSAYVQFDTGTFTSTHTAIFGLSDASTLGQVTIRSSGQFAVREGFTQRALTSHVMVPNQLYRLVWKVNGTSQTLEVRNGATDALIESITGAFASGGFTLLSAGYTSTPSGTLKMSMDRVVIDDTIADIPPYTTPAPTVTVGAAMISSFGTDYLRGGWTLSGGTNFRMVLSTNSDLSNPQYSTSASVPASNWVTARITGLIQNTQYYVGIEVDDTLLTDGRLQGKTLTTDPISYVALSSSCQQTGSNALVFDQMASENAAFFAHQGDLHYAATNVEATWRSAFISSTTTTRTKNFYASTPMTYVYDNNDWAGPLQEADDWSTTTNPATMFRELSGEYGATTTNELSKTWVHGRVRYIRLDLFSQRDDDAMTNGPNKRFISDEQEQWFYDTLENATEPVIVFLSGWPLYRNSGSSTGRWHAYPDQTARIKAWLDARPGIQSRMVAIGGDSHAVQADTGANQDAFGPIPTLNASPLDQSGGLPGGTWDIGVLDVDNSKGYYSRVTITDTGGNEVDFTWDAVQDDGQVLMTYSQTFDASTTIEPAIIRKWSGNGLSAGALTTSSAGAGDTPFDTLNGTGQTIVASGPRSPQIQLAQQSGQASAVQWNYPAMTQGAFRFYWTSPAAMPTNSFSITRLFSGVDHALNVNVMTSGAIRLFEVGGGQTAISSSGVIQVGTRYRIEGHITHNGTSGLATVAVFEPDSDTSIATISGTGNYNTSHENIRFGNSLSTPTVGAMTYDDIAVSDTAEFIGRYQYQVPVYGYEEGVAAQPITTSSPGVVSTGGAPVYTSSTYMHGALAASFPAGSPAPYLRYNTPNATGFTVSEYVYINTIGSSAANPLRIQNDGTLLAAFRFHPDGKFDLSDSGGVRMVSSSNSYTVATWYRVDTQVSVTGSSMLVTSKVFSPSEATTPIDTLSYTFTNASAVNTVQFGAAQASWALTIDTVRIYDSIVEPGPYGTPVSGPNPTVLHSWVGAPTQDSFQVVTKLSVQSAARLAVSTSSNMASPTYLTEQTSDSDGYIRFDATGLASGTQYYYQLEIDGEPSGEIGRAKTLKATGSAQNFTVAVGSCVLKNKNDPVALDDLRTWNPDLFVHLGDFYYTSSASTDPATYENLYADLIETYPGMSQLMREIPSYYCVSDHEAGADNGDSANAWTVAHIEAYRQVVPHRMVDTAPAPRGRWQSWVIGRVRFIMLDIRHLDRTPGLDPDGPSKTMLGATQKAWLKSELLQPELLKVVISDVGWMGPASLVDGEDKWWAYATERQEMIDFIQSNNVNVDLWHGDSHSIAVAGKETNQYGGFPVICASPMAQTGGGRNLGEFDAYYNNSGGEARQYMRITFTDNGDTITRTASGWDAAAGVERVASTEMWSNPPGSIIRNWSGNGLSTGPLTTSSAGSGDDPFDELMGGGHSIVETGPRSPQIELTQPSGQESALRWTYPSQTEGAVRFYWTTPAAWGSNSVSILKLYSASGNPLQINVMINGTMRLFALAGAQTAATGSGVVQNSTRYRIEVRVTHAGASGFAEAVLYEGDSTSPVATISGTGDYGVSHDSARFGNTSTTPTVPTMQLDDLAVSDRAEFIGPVTTYLTQGPTPVRRGWIGGTNQDGQPFDDNTFAKPANVGVGDWMILTMTFTETGMVVNSFPGWTVIGSRYSTGTLYSVVYARTAVAGDSTYAITMSAPASITYTLMWGTGAAPVNEWNIGSWMPRANTGTSTTNVVNPGIVTTHNNSLVLTVSSERTTATETGVTSITGATEWFFQGHNADNIETQSVSFSEVDTAGPTSTVTVTYPNTQSINGNIIQFALPPIALPPVSELVRDVDGAATPGGRTQLTMTMPGLAREGDLAIVLGNVGAGPTVTMGGPAGYTQVINQANSFNAAQIGVWYKKLSPADLGSNVTITASSGRTISMVTVVCVGMEYSGITGAVETTNSPDPVTIQPVTPTHSFALVLTAVTGRAVGSPEPNILSSTGWTELFESWSETGGQERLAYVAARAHQAGAGQPSPTGTVSWSGLSMDTLTATIAVTAPIRVWDGTKQVPAFIKGISDGTTVANGQVKSVVPSSTPVNSTDHVGAFLAAPQFYVSHRCGGGHWPEFSERGVTQSLALGYNALEISVYESSDGQWVCSHDWNTTRMTGQNFAIGSTTWAQLSTLTSTAEFTDDPAQSRTPLIRLSDVLSLVPVSTVLYIDHKETSARTDPDAGRIAQRDRLLDYLDSQPNATNRFIWKVFTAGAQSAQAAKARGYRTWGIYYPSDMGGTIDTQHFDILGQEWNASQANWDPLLATGKPVMGHIIVNVGSRDQAQARGADGYMTSVPKLMGP